MSGGGNSMDKGMEIEKYRAWARRDEWPCWLEPRVCGMVGSRTEKGSWGHFVAGTFE